LSHTQSRTASRKDIHWKAKRGTEMWTHGTCIEGGRSLQGPYKPMASGPPPKIVGLGEAETIQLYGS
jgi:hypothetical protein